MHPAGELLSRQGHHDLGHLAGVTGTAAIWEVSRPVLPSLTVHRRLGGGRAALWVPAGAVDRARRLLGEGDPCAAS